LNSSESSDAASNSEPSSESSLELCSCKNRGERSVQRTASRKAEERKTHVLLLRQEAPSTLLEEVVRVVVDGLHDSLPVEVDGALGEGNVDGTARRSKVSQWEERKREDEDALKPLLHAIQLIRRDGVDVNGRPCKVSEDEDEIEVLQAVLNTLEVGDFDFGEGEDEEGRLGEEDKGFGGGLEEDVGAERDTLETELAERNVDLDTPVRLQRGKISSE
jgi:hypothetical protein